MTDHDPRYPIGKLHRETDFDSARRAELIDQVDAAPAKVREALVGIQPAEWAATYREGGWSIRQVVHHLADSHMNASIRFRLALTEDTPTIKPYHEAAWALLPDVFDTDPEVSLTLLDMLHRRWVGLLRAMSEDSFKRAFFHPEQQRTQTLDDALVIYAWHGRHHTAHIQQARQRGT
jgi:hypothetical protein